MLNPTSPTTTNLPSLHRALKDAQARIARQKERIERLRHDRDIRVDKVARALAAMDKWHASTAATEALEAAARTVAFPLSLSPELDATLARVRDLEAQLGAKRQARRDHVRACMEKERRSLRKKATLAGAWVFKAQLELEHLRDEYRLLERRVFLEVAQLETKFATPTPTSPKRPRDEAYDTCCCPLCPSPSTPPRSERVARKVTRRATRPRSISPFPILHKSPVSHPVC
jgi:hypothetical protein